MLKRMDNVLNVVDDPRDEDAYRLAYIRGPEGPSSRWPSRSAAAHRRCVAACAG
jgi:hypothetical protein